MDQTLRLETPPPDVPDRPPHEEPPIPPPTPPDEPDPVPIDDPRPPRPPKIAGASAGTARAKH